MKYIELSNEEMIFLDAYNKAGEQTKKWVDAILRADLKKARKNGDSFQNRSKSGNSGMERKTHKQRKTA